MKNVLFLVVLALSSQASADIVRCTFTEPFFTLILDTDTRVLTKVEPDFENPDGGYKETVISRTAQARRLAPRVVSAVVQHPRFQVIADGALALVLELNYEGTDSMSDTIYPYSVKYQTFEGGCDSNRLASRR